MKKIKIVFALLLLTLLFSFKNNQEIRIVGIWKMDIYEINRDTIYNQKDEKFTLNYFNKTFNSLDSSNEMKIKNETKSKEVFDSFKNLRLEFTPKFINSYTIDSKGKKTNINFKVSYKVIQNKITMNEKDKERFNYDIDYDFNRDILIIKQIDEKIRIINTYTRTEK